MTDTQDQVVDSTPKEENKLTKEDTPLDNEVTAELAEVKNEDD
jgi:hypothetical protein